jgi:hypothetical protein
MTTVTSTRVCAALRAASAKSSPAARAAPAAPRAAAAVAPMSFGAALGVAAPALRATNAAQRPHRRACTTQAVAATGSGLTLPIDLRGARPGVCQPCTFWVSGCCHRAADSGRSGAQRRRRVSRCQRTALGALPTARAGGGAAAAARWAQRRRVLRRETVPMSPSPRAAPPAHADALTRCRSRRQARLHRRRC